MKILIGLRWRRNRDEERYLGRTTEREICGLESADSWLLSISEFDTGVRDAVHYLLLLSPNTPAIILASSRPLHAHLPPAPPSEFHQPTSAHTPHAPARNIKPDHGREPAATDGRRVPYRDVGGRVARHDMGAAVALVGRDAELVREQRCVEGVCGGVADQAACV